MFKKLKELKLLDRGTAASGKTKTVKYPGVRDAIDGNTAVVLCEREASDAAGAIRLPRPRRWVNTGPKRLAPVTSIFRIGR